MRNIFYLTSLNILTGLLGVFIFTSSAFAASDAGEKNCFECHDAEISSHIKAMVDSKHWDESIKESPVNNKECVACHGDSHSHMGGPTKMQPSISFGPRWTNSVVEQNDTCLNCHEETATHKQWRSGKHSMEDVTCVTCHDVHQFEDIVRIEEKQNQVCNVCHKVQKHGMHHKEDILADNPPCSTCHNPHANPSPVVMMLENRSEGCRTCHDLQKMEADLTVTAKAKSYHRVMSKDDRTCVDCHKGVAHVDKENFGEILTGGLTTMPLELFYPAQSDGDWLLAEHKGAQALRQGRNCRQCHLGDAKSMGQNLAPKGVTPYISAKASVKKRDNNLVIEVEWQGSENDSNVAVMFDNGGVDAFSRQGCWAACHSNMPGMTTDRNYGLKKYLLSSQKQKHVVGTPAILHDKDVLDSMKAKGEYVELWRANLEAGQVASVERYKILETREATDLSGVNATGQFKNGTWKLSFSRPLNDAVKPLTSDSTVTFGIAIHMQEQEGAQHKVSLPMTISVDGQDTDFILK